MSDLNSSSEQASSETNSPEEISFNPIKREPSEKQNEEFVLTEIDRALVMATQEGLPVSERPYQVIGEEVGITEDEVICRLEKMLEHGVIRRIAVIPNHYRIGFKANGMTVWNVKDEEIQRLGRIIGELPYVSHCYRRPRHEPYWSYNLFAMVHGTERSQVEERAEKLKEILGDACLGNQILYSSKILKKTGMRLTKKIDPENPGDK